MHPDRAPVRNTPSMNHRFRFKLTFLSGLEGLKCEITILSVTEGNAAIAAAGMLAKPELWNCTKIERV
jgi:hypothetical protein